MSQPSALNPDEQRQWWLTRAHEALATFGKPQAAVTWLAYTHNAVFSVDDGTQRTILRLQPAETWPRLASEIAVLGALGIHNLAAPRPLGSTRLNDVAALLLSYLDGASPPLDHAQSHHLRAIGDYLGRLHGADLPTDQRPRLDWEGLFGAGVYDPGSTVAPFSDEQQRVIEATTERVRVVMQTLDDIPHSTGLIHGDLLLKNVLFTSDGHAQALDWEYCGWGYYLYDLTPILWMLKPRSDYPELEQALWRGYTSHRSVAVSQHDHLETLIAARQVASMRWLAANQHLPAYAGKGLALLARRTAELRDFLETGILNRR